MPARNRRAAREPVDDFGVDDHVDDGGGLALDTRDEVRPHAGPHDSEDLDPEVTDAIGCVDFGSIRVPVPASGTVTVEPTANGRMQAVHIALPAGRLSVSALAAPKSSKLWPALAEEIDASLRDGGARVRSFNGEWGRELHATSGEARSVFVGVDGPRWMLYGVATGPTTQSEDLEADLRQLLRGSVVVRGRSPYPVRTILPLSVPEHLADAVRVDGPGTGAKSGAAKKKTAKAAAKNTAPKQTAPKKGTSKRAAAKPGQRARTRPELPPTVAEAAETVAAAGQLAPPATPPSTVRTGPDPDAPLREQAPSARRAAAASWRNGSTAPEPGTAPYGTPHPAADPADRDDRAWDAQDRDAYDRDAHDGHELPPTDAVRQVPPGAVPPASGGRRRLREPGAEPAGRRRLRGPESDAPPQPSTGGRRRLREPVDDIDAEPAAPPPATVPPETGGRRRLREDPPRPPAGTGPEIGSGFDGSEPTDRARWPEPTPPARESTPPAPPARQSTPPVPPAQPATPPPPPGEPEPPAGGRRRLRAPETPGAAAGSSNGHYYRPDQNPLRVDRPQPPAAARVAPVERTAPWDAASIEGTGGRRRLREPDAAGFGDQARGGRSSSDPGDPVSGDPGAGGRRRLREPVEPSALSTTGTGPDLPSVRPAADLGTVGGRRRRRDPDELAPDEFGPPVPGPDRGRNAAERTGRHGLVDGPAADRATSLPPVERPSPELPPVAPTERSPGPSGGRRRLREPDPTAVSRPDPLGADDAGPGPDGPRRWETADQRPDLDRPAERGGRRRLREPESDGPDVAAPRWDRNAVEPGAGGRRRRPEPDGLDGPPLAYGPVLGHDPVEDPLGGPLNGLANGPANGPANGSVNGAGNGGRRARRSASDPADGNQLLQELLREGGATRTGGRHHRRAE